MTRQNFAGERFILCIIENYDSIVEPIDRIALYLSVLGLALLGMAWSSSYAAWQSSTGKRKTEDGITA